MSYDSRAHAQPRTQSVWPGRMAMEVPPHPVTPASGLVERAMEATAHLTQIAGHASLATMPEPLPKIPEDPELRLALAIKFLAAFEAAKTDDDVNDWLKASTPRLVDAVAIAELALAQCTTGSQWEPLRESMANVVTHLQRQIIQYDEHMETLGKQDMFGAMRRAIYDMASSGDLPVDWQTREGCKFSVCRWITEFFDTIGDRILYEREGDKANARLAMLDTYAALETAMDRMLTLPAEDRARFLPLIEPLYTGYMANREKNLGE